MTKREKIISIVLETPLAVLAVIFFALMLTGADPDAVAVTYCLVIGYASIVGLIIGIVDIIKLKKEGF